MTDKQIAIGRRAVACKDWRWMSGMATAEGHRVVLVDDDCLWMVYNEEGKCKPGCVEDFVPDLTDPATLGCLLALVREARDDTTLGVIRQDLGTMRSKEAWFICGEGGADVVWAHTEIDALLDALEVA